VIHIFGSDGGLLPLVYDQLGINYTLNVMSAEPGDAAGMAGTRITAAAPSSAIDYISDKFQWRDGMEVYGITKVSKIWVLNGFVHGTSPADLADRVKALAHAFDPGYIAWRYPEDPFRDLVFSVPTTDLTNHPTGYVESTYLLFPLEGPEPIVANAGLGLARRFSITLLARDPRRYLVAQTLANAGTFANSEADYPTQNHTITFTMSGAGNAAFTVTNTATMHTSNLVFDLSGLVNNDVVTIDFDRQRVLVDGVETQGIYVSGVWFQIEPGNNVIAYTNATNTGTKTLSARAAFGF
jgi:hypothetical protein